jgi:hypothetical protein
MTRPDVGSGDANALDSAAMNILPAARAGAPRSRARTSSRRQIAGAAPGRARGRAFVAAALLGATLAACDRPGDGEHQLESSRVYEPVGRQILWGAPPAQRYGISARDFAMPGDDAAVGGLHWTTPAGWKERPAAMFRDANFFVAGDERAECYLTTLGGDAGGLEANINRWRGQLSLPPLTGEELAALPRVPWLGGLAVEVDFEGSFRGMSGDQTADGYRLVGLALMAPDRSRFLKMIGPREVIARELEAFRMLAGSFHEGAGHEHGEAPAPASAPVAMPPPSASTTAGVTPEEAQVADGAAGPGADAQGNASLTWRTPAGWTRGPEKSMREVTYLAGEGRAVETYVTLLAGTGGGMLENINRWCGQLGSPPLAEADLAALPRVTVSGVEGVLVSLPRGPGATAPEGQELLLGVLCQLPDRALFVKMTGPRDAVLAQQGALVEFARSIQALR